MAGILAGLTVVEGSAFVAIPFAGMTLTQMGADVIRFDPIGGGLDHHRWPVTAAGRSLFWAGLNKGKRSIAVDMKAPEGREILARLVTAPGEGRGLFMTNLRARGFLDYPALAERRADLVMVSLTGDRRGGPQVDYTVNPAVGFPFATGPEGFEEPVGHALPAFDLIAGQKAALSLMAAERHRLRTGEGQLVEFSLKDTAVAVTGDLGIVGEAVVNGTDRPRAGNGLFGAYADDFLLKDGARVMVVALTRRQWDNLLKVTETGEAMAALGSRLGLDLGEEGNRWLARREITAVLEPWFSARTFEDVAGPFAEGGVTFSRYRTFREAVAEDPDFSTDNPMMAVLDQPGIGRYPVPGSPVAFGAFARVAPRRAPLLGEHTDAILSEIGYAEGEIARLHDAGVVATDRP